MSLDPQKVAIFQAFDGLLDAHLADWPEWIFETFEAAKATLFCRDGHTPIDDQCGLPEHRFCFFCGMLTPHAALEVT
jgi:hypothetical protein